MRALDAALKQRIGKAAFAWPLLSTLAAPAPRLAVEIDGAAHEAASIVIARARSYAGRYVLVPRAGLHRPGLHVVLLRSQSRRARLRQLVALARGRLEGDRDVTIVPAERVIVRAEMPVPVQLDGDPAGTTPLDVRAGGPCLNLIVPPAFLQRG
jgi:diacylglycerol kinase family enzyme